jgi:cell filamentation protein (fic)
LERKLREEGVELVRGTHGFKFEAPDGKQRVADVLNSEGVLLLAKNYPNNRANDFLDRFTYSYLSLQITFGEWFSGKKESIAKN